MSDIRVRDALLSDAPTILNIYAYYVENTAITFEYELPSLHDFKARMTNIMEKYPYLVIEEDGVILGYAYAGAFIGRAAYDWSCELTIYLKEDSLKRGLGRKLYEALEKKLKAMGMLNLYACIGYPNTENSYINKNSAQFHAHLGFTQVGLFKKCGYKFGCWFDMIWMEKLIGQHEAKQPAVINYQDL